ncbi:hypothetical protein K8089_10095 [Aequorivita sp. F47161]|uniref:Uncharacterized protein n=1 Tax=Aequorivita vitellina TaxID=2874475 RepID=A0A9X1U0X1_9FLAO|nr:hypothetical protein [Aequorivita vitellina]MCG2419374.1 hypothetical protein [Aequorivita vitellina]
MKTIAIILGLIILYVPLKFIGTIIMNITGLPGAIIAYKTTNEKQTKHIIGVIICLIFHLYTYFSIMIYVMNWTRHLTDSNSISRYFIWFFCLVLLTGTIEGIYRNAKNEFLENKSEGFDKTNYLNPQIKSLDILRVFVFIGFWIALFLPEYTNPLWSWVNNIGFLI